jgi:hypothetical protein
MTSRYIQANHGTAYWLKQKQNKRIFLPKSETQFKKRWKKGGMEWNGMDRSRMEHAGYKLNTKLRYKRKANQTLEYTVIRCVIRCKFEVLAARLLGTDFRNVTLCLSGSVPDFSKGHSALILVPSSPRRVAAGLDCVCVCICVCVCVCVIRYLVYLCDTSNSMRGSASFTGWPWRGRKHYPSKRRELTQRHNITPTRLEYNTR